MLVKPQVFSSWSFVIFYWQIVKNFSSQWVDKLLTKSDSMFTLACEHVLHFWVRKSKPVKPLIQLFSHVKEIVQPIKTLMRQISHVKNIVWSEIGILFQPNTTRKSPYSYNKISDGIVKVMSLLFFGIVKKQDFKSQGSYETRMTGFEFWNKRLRKVQSKFIKKCLESL